MVVDCSDSGVDATSDQQRGSSSTVDRRTHQTAPRCQSTSSNTTYGCVERHFVVTDDDLHAAEARLDDAETYVRLTSPTSTKIIKFLLKRIEKLYWYCKTILLTAGRALKRVQTHVAFANKKM